MTTVAAGPMRFEAEGADRGGHEDDPEDGQNDGVVHRPSFPRSR
jgi:hypothetical protein